MRYFLAFVLIISAQFLTSCASKPVDTGTTIVSDFVCEDVKASWELPTNDGQVTQGAMPSRHAWTVKMCGELRKAYPVLIIAKDIDTIIPRRAELSKEQHIAVLTELMSTVTEYEISWNAAGTAKDVNGRSEPDYRATGLCQLNVGDQKIYKTGTSFTATELKNPLNNIEACVGILVTVVKVRGKITFSRSEKSSVLSYFFATLLTDTAYGKKTLTPAHARIAKLVAGF